jgi:uncharacterized phage protein (TIGR02218 family)
LKNVGSPLLDYLLSTDVESTTICDLFTVTLVSGLVVRATDFQIPLTHSGNVYLPTRWGSWRTNGTKCGIGSMNASADFEIFAGTDELMPTWNCSINEAAQLGLFDAATITILTAYDVGTGIVASGFTEIRFGGQITEFTPVGRTTIKGVAKPYTFTLNRNMPRKVLQPSCGWTLYDAGCTVNPAGFTFTNSVGAGTNASVITAATTITQASGFFTQGVIKFTSGANAGLSQGIVTHAGQLLQLSRPFFFPVNLGDTFQIIAGCDHTQLTCLSKFSNLINFGGAPYIPDRERAI